MSTSRGITSCREGVGVEMQRMVQAEVLRAVKREGRVDAVAVLDACARADSRDLERATEPLIRDGAIEPAGGSEGLRLTDAGLRRLVAGSD